MRYDFKPSRWWVKSGFKSKTATKQFLLSREMVLKCSGFYQLCASSQTNNSNFQCYSYVWKGNSRTHFLFVWSGDIPAVDPIFISLKPLLQQCSNYFIGWCVLWVTWFSWIIVSSLTDLQLLSQYCYLNLNKWGKMVLLSHYWLKYLLSSYSRSHCQNVIRVLLELTA